jgi:hypothetical protein
MSNTPNIRSWWGSRSDPPMRARVWLETALAALCGSLAVLTAIWPDWIEAPTGLSPDRHDGSLERVIVAVLFVLCAVFGLAARAEWRRSAVPMPSQG